MEIPVLLFHFLKSGEISLLTKGKKSLELKVESKNLNINLLDRKLMKDLMKASSKEKTFFGRFRSLRNIANSLKSEGLTVTISYEGAIVLKLGYEASSSALGDAIEIKDLSKLLRLSLM